jgi:dethiobiotin synthetase
MNEFVGVIMKSTWFITGTDTGIGKTWCTLALIQHFKNQGCRVAGMKPIATGCYHQQGHLRSRDAEMILTTSGLEVPYEWVNPYAFEPPIAPHLAAIQAGITIEVSSIVDKYQQLCNHADVIVIEGIGGWRVPINTQQTLTDLVFALDIPVILVVGLRLGCINHALLTAETIKSDGCTLAGWIANSIDPQFNTLGSIATLKQRLMAPLLAQIPYLMDLDPFTQTWPNITI